MKIEYKADIDVLYIRFSNTEFHQNHLTNDNVIADLDKDGNIIALELLDASHYVNNVESVEYRYVTPRPTTVNTTG